MKPRAGGRPTGTANDMLPVGGFGGAGGGGLTGFGQLPPLPQRAVPPMPFNSQPGMHQPIPGNPFQQNPLLSTQVAPPPSFGNPQPGGNGSPNIFPISGPPQGQTYTAQLPQTPQFGRAPQPGGMPQPPNGMVIDPQWQQQKAAFDQQMVSQGLQPGSAAYMPPQSFGNPQPPMQSPQGGALQNAMLQSYMKPGFKVP